jgi:hypothetical protein
MRKRIPTVVMALACLLLAALLGGPAGATAGSFDDKQDTQGPIDVKQVRHDNTQSTITYELETFADPYASGSPDELDWFLDFDGDGGTDVVVTADIRDPSALRGNVRTVSGASIEPATVTHPSSTVFRVVWDRAGLDNVPQATGKTKYKYEVEGMGFDNQQNLKRDSVPDSATLTINHDLGAAGSPTPSGSPSGSPTASPSASPTAAPTATPVVTPGPGGTPTPGPGTNTQSPAGITSSTLNRNSPVTISGGGFSPNAVLSISFLSNPVFLGTTTANGSGNYLASVRVPASATAGAHRINVTGPNPFGGTHTSFADVTIVAASLPTTGDAPARPPIAPGLALLATGAGLLLVHKTRAGSRRPS